MLATAIIAAGKVFLMISGEIDLSVGQVFALTAFIMYFLEDAGVPLMLAVVVSLIAASLIGLVNGVITTVVGVSSFITTLGMFFFLNGLTLTISSDGHSTKALRYVELGVAQARRAWLTKKQILNTRTWPEIEKLRK